MVACPLEGLVGRTSSLKIGASLVHLWLDQYHAGLIKATQAPVFHQNEQGLQSFGCRDVLNGEKRKSLQIQGPGVSDDVDTS